MLCFAMVCFILVMVITMFGGPLTKSYYHIKPSVKRGINRIVVTEIRPRA